MKQRTANNARQSGKQQAKSASVADQAQQAGTEHEPTKHPAKVTVPDLKLSL